MKPLLANVKSRSRSLYAIARLSVCRQCDGRSTTLLSRLNFSTMFLRHLVPWPSVDIHGTFYGDRPRGTPPSGEELNARGVAKYSDLTFRRLYLANGAR